MVCNKITFMNRVLETTKFVVENSEFVKINHERLVYFSNSFEHGKTKHWLSAAPFNFSHFNNEDKLHFVFILNTLSFSYWGEPNWKVEYNGKVFNGAWGMILALGRAIEEGIPILDFEYCKSISKVDFYKVLRGTTEIPLFEERLRMLREVGTVMSTKYNGKVSNLIIEASEDALKLTELIVRNFSSFSDTSLYKDREICFYKRAQLLTADIYQIFDGWGFGKLKNVNQITAFADYKIPQILRKLEILEYIPNLVKKIDNKIEISHNSPEEVEIRANTIWAIEFIKEEVKKHNPKIMSSEINDHLWLATQEKFDGDEPYHRTRTTAY